MFSSPWRKAAAWQERRASSPCPTRVVSRSISDLERALRVQLLERNRRGAELTDYGSAMLSRTNAAFDELRQGVKDIEALADPTAGEVRIGTTPSLAASFVSAVIDRLVKRYPRIVFHVAVEAGEAPGNLIERRVDLLVFRRNRAPADERLRFDFLFESPYVVAAGTKIRGLADGGSRLAT